jgi:hypothetical protein
MTYLGSDGFDNGTLRFLAADYNDAAHVTIQATAHTGTYALRLEDAGHWVRKAVTGTPPNCSVSVWIDPDTNYNDNDGFRIRYQLTSTEYIEIRWNGATHTFDAYVNGGIVQSGGVFVDTNDWFYVEFYAFADNAGFIRTKINGTDDIVYLGNTLPPLASAQIAYVYLYCGATGYVYFDDFVWGEGQFLGDCRVRWFVPTADTVVDDWSPNVGPDSYQDVDEVPASDVDYLTSNANGEETELEVDDIVISLGEIALVSSVGRISSIVDGTYSVEIGVDSNGTDDATAFSAYLDWRYYQHAMERNPDGNVPWTAIAVNALKSRIESVI